MHSPRHFKCSPGKTFATTIVLLFRIQLTDHGQVEPSPYIYQLQTYSGHCSHGGMSTLSHFGQSFYFLEISNMKRLVGLTWDSNPDTVQALGLETAMIPLSHGGSCIYVGQIVESLVIISPTHLKNLCWLFTRIAT